MRLNVVVSTLLLSACPLAMADAWQATTYYGRLLGAAERCGGVTKDQLAAFEDGIIAFSGGHGPLIFAAAREAEASSRETKSHSCPELMKKFREIDKQFERDRTPVPTVPDAPTRGNPPSKK